MAFMYNLVTLTWFAIVTAAVLARFSNSVPGFAALALPDIPIFTVLRCGAVLMTVPLAVLVAEELLPVVLFLDFDNVFAHFDALLQTHWVA